jgi:hypothetical protein
VIAVNDIILKLRSRLGDNEPSKQKWSDAELIDNINSALTQLAVSMIYSFKTQKYIVSRTNNRFELPYNIARIVAITIKDERATIKSFQWLQNSKQRLKSDEFVVCMDDISFFLYPLELLEDGVEILFDYNHIQQINDVSENIDMSIMLSDAILFYAMHMSLQVNTSEKNANKSLHYLNLFDKQVSTMSGVIYKNRHSKRLTSRYKRI